MSLRLFSTAASMPGFVNCLIITDVIFCILTHVGRRCNLISGSVPFNCIAKCVLRFEGDALSISGAPIRRPAEARNLRSRAECLIPTAGGSQNVSVA